MAISSAAQFVLLLWKNWLLQKRRIVVTVFQIVMPTLIALLLLGIRALVSSKFVYAPTWNWNSFDALTSPNLSVPGLPMLGTFDPRNLMPGSVNATNPTMPNWTLPIPDLAGNLFKWQLVYSPNTSSAARRMARNITGMLGMTPIGISS